MAISEGELRTIEARLFAASGDSWEPAEREGVPVVVVRFEDGRETIMRVTRELAPASTEDVEFVGYARRDTQRLIEHLRVATKVSEQELGEIELRCNEASPTPWEAFLESAGGIGGCSVIWVTKGEKPDLYLWIDNQLAPDPDFEFVASARQHIPELLAASKKNQ